MTERAEYLRALEWFKGEMDRKLSRPKNLEKVHWSEIGEDGLFFKIHDELDELWQAMTKPSIPLHNDPKAIISECCDVANFAMMLADLARMRLEGHDG